MQPSTTVTARERTADVRRWANISVAAVATTTTVAVAVQIRAAAVTEAARIAGSEESAPDKRDGDASDKGSRREQLDHRLAQSQPIPNCAITLPKSSANWSPVPRIATSSGMPGNRLRSLP